MKKILSLFVFSVLASSIVLADRTKTVSTKFGEKRDDKPIANIFNKNRMWNPEKVLWNDEYWKCAYYKKNGVCAEVEKIKNNDMVKNIKEPSKIEKKTNTIPPLHLWNKNRRWNPPLINWSGFQWKCSSYKEDGTCTKVQKVSDLRVE
jgi:hypothetical protein